MSYLYHIQSRKKVRVFSPSMTYFPSGHYLILPFFLKVLNQFKYLSTLNDKRNMSYSFPVFVYYLPLTKFLAILHFVCNVFVIDNCIV